MARSLPSSCQFAPAGFRIVQSPIIPLPQNHLLLYSLCPCGRHRTHFTMHRSLLLAQIGRNQSLSQNIRALSHLQRQAEVHLQARIRRLTGRKDTIEPVLIESDNEEVDR